MPKKQEVEIIIPPKKKNYLNNKDLLAAVIDSKQRGEMSPRLAHMLQTLCARYGRKGNFANYTYNEDMQAYAMLSLVRTWDSFKPEKSNNPFAFFTQCIKNSFIQYLNQEKRQRDIRDAQLVDNGLAPSHSYTNSHSSKQDRTFAEDEEDFHVNSIKETDHEVKETEDDLLKF